ncbi:hypothetical protein R6Z07M_012632 [Ovis aries]
MCARRSRQTTPRPEEQTVTRCDVLSKSDFDPTTQVPSADFATAGTPGPTCVPLLPARNGPWRQRQWLLSRHSLRLALPLPVAGGAGHQRNEPRDQPLPCPPGASRPAGGSLQNRLSTRRAPLGERAEERGDLSPLAWEPPLQSTCGSRGLRVPASRHPAGAVAARCSEQTGERTDVRNAANARPSRGAPGQQPPGLERAASSAAWAPGPRRPVVSKTRVLRRLRRRHAEPPEETRGARRCHPLLQTLGRSTDRGGATSLP